MDFQNKESEVMHVKILTLTTTLFLKILVLKKKVMLVIFRCRRVVWFSKHENLLVRMVARNGKKRMFKNQRRHWCVVTEIFTKCQKVEFYSPNMYKQSLFLYSWSYTKHLPIYLLILLSIGFRLTSYLFFKYLLNIEQRV